MTKTDEKLAAWVENAPEQYKELFGLLFAQEKIEHEELKKNHWGHYSGKALFSYDNPDDILEARLKSGKDYAKTIIDGDPRGAWEWTIYQYAKTHPQILRRESKTALNNFFRDKVNPYLPEEKQYDLLDY